MNTLMNYKEIYGGGGKDIILIQIFSSVLFSHFKQIRGGGKHARLQMRARIKILSSKSSLSKSRNLLFDAKECCWASLEMQIKTYQGPEATHCPSKFAHFKYRHTYLYKDNPLWVGVHVLLGVWELELPTGKSSTVYQPVNSFLPLHEFAR